MIGRYIILFSYIAIVLHQFEMQTASKFELLAMEEDSAPVARKIANKDTEYSKADGVEEMVNLCIARRQKARAITDKRKSEREALDVDIKDKEGPQLHGHSCFCIDKDNGGRQCCARMISTVAFETCVFVLVVINCTCLAFDA